MIQNKIVLSALVVLLIGTGGFVVVQTSKPGDFVYPVKAYFSGEVAYVSDVSGEVDLLESELAGIEVQIANGTLTPESAHTARAKIITRLDTITTTMNTASNATLSLEMRTKLSAALTKLNSVLSIYRDSLNTLETIAGPDTKRALNARGNSHKTLSEIITDTASIIEDHLETVSDEQEESDVDQAAAVVEEESTITDESTEAEVTEEDTQDQSATSSEEDTTAEVDIEGEVGVDAEPVDAEATTSVEEETSL